MPRSAQRQEPSRCSGGPEIQLAGALTKDHGRAEILTERKGFLRLRRLFCELRRGLFPVQFCLGIGYDDR